MKKICLFLVLFVFLTTNIQADTKSEALEFFDRFVNLSNEYNLDALNMYAKNPVIKRRVLKKKPVTVIVPFSELVKMQRVFNKHKNQLKNTKNYYNNRVIISLENDKYKITAKRCPTVMNKCFDSYMIIQKQNDEFKILEEFSDVQTTYFLRFKEK